MIGVFTLAERVVDPRRVATTMTVLASATGLGYALGSGIAGRLADQHGYTAAFAVTVTAMAVAVTLVAIAQRGCAPPSSLPGRRRSWSPPP